MSERKIGVKRKRRPEISCNETESEANCKDCPFFDEDAFQCNYPEGGCCGD